MVVRAWLRLFPSSIVWLVSRLGHGLGFDDQGRATRTAYALEPRLEHKGQT